MITTTVYVACLSTDQREDSLSVLHFAETKKKSTTLTLLIGPVQKGSLQKLIIFPRYSTYVGIRFN